MSEKITRFDFYQQGKTGRGSGGRSVGGHNGFAIDIKLVKTPTKADFSTGIIIPKLDSIQVKFEVIFQKKTSIQYLTIVLTHFPTDSSHVIFWWHKILLLLKFNL